MKILMIGWGLPQNTSGGLDTYCKYVSSEMSKEHEVYLTLPEFNVPEDVEDMGSVCIIPIQCEKKEKLLDTVLEYNKNIVEGLCHEKYDVVHSNDWFGVMAANRIKECTKTPFVLTLHSTEYMRRAAESREKCDLDFLENMGIKNSDIIITVSNLMKKEIAEKYNINRDKIKVVHNGFIIPDKPADKGYIKKKHDTGKDKTVLYIGRLAKQKGVEYLINAAREVLKKRPDTTFVICGFGHFEIALRRLAKIMRMESKIIFAGKIKDEELYPYYSSADVFVSPSVWEPFGLTITEAMSQKIPVIATTSAGAVEDMEDGKDVIKVRPRSSKEIASAIIRLLENEKLAEKVAENGFDFCKKNFSWEECAKRTVEVYKSI